MEKIVTAFVLDREPVREYDELVHLYTKELGYIVARAISSRKIHSKFSGHLDPLTLVQARVVYGQSLTLTDVVSKNRFTNLRKKRTTFAAVLKFFSFVKKFFPRESGHDQLWELFHADFLRGEAHIDVFLSLLGFDTHHARCTKCDAVPVTYFYTLNQSFFCKKCGSKIPESAVLYIG